MLLRPEHWALADRNRRLADDCLAAITESFAARAWPGHCWRGRDCGSRELHLGAALEQVETRFRNWLAASLALLALVIVLGAVVAQRI